MFHREGVHSIIITIILIVILNIFILFLGESEIVKWIGYLVSAFLLIMVLLFFRNPKRKIQCDDKLVLSPADGKVVVVEEVFDNEYFKAKRLQVSVFMSPVNVHVNRYPISGKILFYKYYPGRYLVAWHPKSSVENEHTTVVVKNDTGIEILFKQIAGVLARRIVFYGREGETVKQGEQCGFIKFGSRVDVLLPPNAKINVKLGDNVKGGISIIATV